MWVPKHLATTPVLIKVYEGLDENGAKSYTDNIEIKAATFNDCSVAYTSEGEKKRLKAKAYVFEGLGKLEVGMTGTCYFEGKEFDIATTAKYVNPDGTPNYFILGLV